MFFVEHDLGIAVRQLRQIADHQRIDSYFCPAIGRPHGNDDPSPDAGRSDSRPAILHLKDIPPAFDLHLIIPLVPGVIRARNFGAAGRLGRQCDCLAGIALDFGGRGKRGGA